MEFLNASSADLTTLFFHHYKTLKAVATAAATAAIVVLTPPPPIFIFTHFRRPILTYSHSPLLLRLLAQKLQKQKSLLESMCRKSKQKT